MTRVQRWMIHAPLTAALLILAACSHDAENNPDAPETVAGVNIVNVAVSTTPDTVEATGTVRAADEAVISAQTMGNILAVNVREGDRVRKGQVLARIDGAEAALGAQRAQAMLNQSQHEIAVAESGRNLAESTAKRYETLYQRKSISPQEYDEVKARAQSAQERSSAAQASAAQAKAALEQSRHIAGYATLRAPFDGVVSHRSADAGTLASPGLPILTIERAGKLQLEVNLDESVLPAAKVGSSVAVTIDALATKNINGKITQIVPTADDASRSFTVKIELPSDSSLHSGIFGRANFVKGERKAILIPQSSVVERGALRGVFAIGADGVASLRYLTLGRTSGDNVEVLSGLNSGERIIAAPGAREFGGKRIEAAR